jgi:hypothetical protein
VLISIFFSYSTQISEDNDLKVVPQNQDEDVEMWNVNDEDEETAKQEKIRSRSFLPSQDTFSNGKQDWA